MEDDYLENQKKSIQGFYTKNKRMPTYRELAHLVGFKSTNAAYRLVTKLESRNFLSRDKKGHIIPGKLWNTPVHVLGSISAGFPSSEEEQLLETITLDEWLLGKNKTSTYILEVSGDSMKDAGIIDGDYIVVEKSSQFRVNDIVVAEVDNEWTVKYLRRGPGGYFLEPANPKYKNIYPSHNLTITAIVKGVVRRYA